jgi:hypothetical protein
MPNALTLDDMSPGLRKVVGRESPRATSAEEPDAGNPLVRIWRGAGTGNLPAYSTRYFCSGVYVSALPEPPHLDSACESLYRCLRLQVCSLALSGSKSHGGWGERHLRCAHIASETTRDVVGLGNPIERCVASPGRRKRKWDGGQLARTQDARADRCAGTWVLACSENPLTLAQRGPSVRGMHLHTQSPSQSVARAVQSVPHRRCAG